jgi:CRP-like cAMP-binding protein
VWTKTQLLKLVNYIIEPRQYIRNQIVYREGDRADSIFMIKQGDFEVSRKY